MMEKPDVDLIEGLSPSISIDQKTTSKIPDQQLELLLKYTIILEYYLLELEFPILQKLVKK